MHGKLQEEEQDKVFEEIPQRKIIFSTNIAETSLTIPTIKHVIDTGLMKENIFDPEQNLSMLKLVPITQSSAEQRKGRAGRVSAGKCYRLFNEEDYSLRSTSQCPEILRCDLSLAILKLIHLGNPRVREFDFVESPSCAAIEKSITSLLLLQAVNENNGAFTLTPEGKKLLKIEKPVYFGKLILTGVKLGVGFDAIIVAVFGANFSNLFWKSPDKEVRENTEKLRLKYCTSTGDAAMVLNIFREFNSIQKFNAKKQFCNTNGINFKTMKNCVAGIKELISIFQKIGIQVPETQLEDPDDIRIRQSIVSGFCESVATYTKSSKIGYCVLGSLVNAKIQNGTCLSSSMLNRTPQWISFLSLNKIGEFGLTMNFCNSIEPSWFDDIEGYSALYNLNTFEDNAVLREYNFPNLTSSTIRYIRENYSELKYMEEQYKIIIEISDFEIAVFATKLIGNQYDINSLMLNWLQEINYKLQNWIEFFPLNGEGDVQVIGCGGSTVTFLAHDEAMMIKIIGISYETEKSDITSIIHDPILYVEIRKFINLPGGTQQNYALVSFPSAEHVENFCSRYPEKTIRIKNVDCKCILHQPYSSAVSQNKLSIKAVFSWQAETTSKGCGYVKFASESTCTDAFKQTKGASFRVSRSKKNPNTELFAQNFSTSWSDEDLKQQFYPNLPSSATILKITNQPKEWNSLQYKLQLLTDLKNLLSIDKNYIKFNFYTEKRKSAAVSIESVKQANKLQKTAESIHFTKPFLNMSVKIQFSLVLRVPKPLYSALSAKFSTLTSKFSCKVKEDSNGNKKKLSMVTLHFSTTEVSDARHFQREFEKVCTTKVIFSREKIPAFEATKKLGNNVHIFKSKNVYFIIGEVSTVDNLVKNFLQQNVQVKKNSKQKNSEIVLPSFNAEKFLQLLDSNSDFIDIIQERFKVKVILNPLNETLVIRGISSKKNASIIEHAFTSGVIPLGGSSCTEICSFCKTNVSNFIKVHQCKHIVCKPCIKSILANALSAGNLPLTCWCKNSLILPDIIDNLNISQQNSLARISRAKAMPPPNYFKCVACGEICKKLQSQTETLCHLCA